MSFCSCFPIASDGGHSDSAINVSLSADELEQQGKELTRNIEFENLDGSLDGQRQIENDSKQNQHVDKNKKTDGTIAENAGKDVPLVCSGFGEGDDLSIHELQKYSEADVGEIAKRHELNLMPVDPPAVETKKTENLMAIQEDSGGWITVLRPK